MTIEEAIRLQELLCESSILDPLPMYREATKLGSEALKAVVIYRQGPPQYLYNPLPGETKD